MTGTRSTNFDWTIENNKAFAASLDKLGKATDDFRIPFRIISSDFYRSNKAIFSLKGPGKYEDLSTKPFTAWWEKDQALNRHYPEGYKEYKRAKYGFSYPILVGGTRDLSNSVLGKNHRNSVFFAGRKELIIGSNVPYGKYHQSDKPRTKIPQRKFVFIDGGPTGINGRRERWINIVDTHTKQLIDKGI